MYQKTVKSKMTGGIIAIVLLLLVTGVLCFLATFEKTTLIFAALFGLGAMFVGIGLAMYKVRLNEMQEQFSDDIETSVERCTDQVAEKYFFFSDCIVDLWDARLIYYDQIEESSAVRLAEIHKNGDTHHRGGAAINFTMKNGKVCMISHFSGGLSSKVKTELENYDRFRELFNKYYHAGK